MLSRKIKIAKREGKCLQYDEILSFLKKPARSNTGKYRNQKKNLRENLPITNVSDQIK